MRYEKWFIIIGIAVPLVLIITVAMVLPSTWSKRSFEAVVQEGATQQGDIISLTVEKITEIYGDPLCALNISERTKIFAENGNIISAQDIQKGYLHMPPIQDIILHFF